MISYEKIVGYNNGKEGVKFMICHHYYFKDKFHYQPYICKTNFIISHIFVIIVMTFQ